eukprot:scaffold122219_cov19-Prasinocladus_malaysianus.AAC.2
MQFTLLLGLKKDTEHRALPVGNSNLLASWVYCNQRTWYVFAATFDVTATTEVMLKDICR